MTGNSTPADELSMQVSIPGPFRSENSTYGIGPIPKAGNPQRRIVQV